MKTTTILAIIASVILLGSCAFSGSGSEIHISIKMPSIDGLGGPSSGSKFIAPGTASFAVTITADDSSSSSTQRFDAPALGGSATIVFRGVDSGIGPATLRVDCLDARGNVISTGTSPLSLVPGANNASVTLAPQAFYESGVYMDLGQLWSDTIQPGEVKVHRFQLSTDAWQDYAVTIGDSPCILGVYDANLARFPNVVGSPEKWALRKELAFDTEYFYVSVANPTNQALSYAISCERAFYVKPSGPSGTGAREAPYTASDLQATYSAAAWPVRILMEEGDYAAPLSLEDAKSLYGGFSADGLWTRDIAAHVTRIHDGTITGGTDGCMTAGAGVTRDTIVDGITLDAADYQIGTVSALSYTVLSISDASPVIRNCRIIGPGVNCASAQNFPQVIRGVAASWSAGTRPGPLLARNLIIGGSVFGVGSVPSFDTSATFVGVEVSGFAGRPVQSYPLLVANDIVAWIGRDEPYQPGTTAIFSIYGWGVISAGPVNLLGNTIDGGRPLVPWTQATSRTEVALLISGSPDFTASRNNLLGLSDSSAPPAGQAALNSGSVMGPDFSRLLPLFIYRAAAASPLAYLYPGTSVTSIATLAVTVPGVTGAMDSAANLDIFASPLTGYGDRRLSGTWATSTVNPCEAGADLLSDAAIAAALPSLTLDFLRWDKDGKQRTAPWSIGAFEF